MSETTDKRRNRKDNRRPAAEAQKTTGVSRATAPGRAAPRPRRKNLILDQSRIDRARTVLGAATETETITRALDAVIDLAVMREEAVAAIEPLLGTSEIVNYFDDPEALDWSGFEPAAKPPGKRATATKKR